MARITDGLCTFELFNLELLFLILGCQTIFKRWPNKKVQIMARQGQPLGIDIK